MVGCRWFSTMSGTAAFRQKPVGREVFELQQVTGYRVDQRIGTWDGRKQRDAFTRNPEAETMIGIVNGDSSMAPISTAADGSNNPSSEIIAEMKMRMA